MQSEVWTNNVEDPICLFMTNILKAGFTPRYFMNNCEHSTKNSFPDVVQKQLANLIQFCEDNQTNNYYVIFENDEIKGQGFINDNKVEEVRKNLASEFYFGRAKKPLHFAIGKEKVTEIGLSIAKDPTTAHHQGMFTINGEDFDWIDIEVFRNNRYTDEQAVAALEIQVRKYIARKGLKPGEDFVKEMEKAVFYLIAALQVLRGRRSSLNAVEIRDTVVNL